jgi:hypothetical protein
LPAAAPTTAQIASAEGSFGVVARQSCVPSFRACAMDERTGNHEAPRIHRLFGDRIRCREYGFQNGFYAILTGFETARVQGFCKPLKTKVNEMARKLLIIKAPVMN